MEITVAYRFSDSLHFNMPDELCSDQSLCHSQMRGPTSSRSRGHLRSNYRSE
ncbi:hypothetical protein RE6C_01972 [Rhodopirellula europaea 6C]|uniref:Uncharacterized protein n=1 Tax=Rhodopirellula europaea 6C TaxID=1263867 RepID=M2B5F6_9BACT|nr:hypothetical protein RE6C_01972 [Rhodopirellula europaea 6C]